jgi:hypothetical protein
MFSLILFFRTVYYFVSNYYTESIYFLFTIVLCYITIQVALIALGDLVSPIKEFYYIELIVMK